MSKEEESSKEWKYNGDEEEWDTFDRRMIRYMRKKYDIFGERLWLGQVNPIHDDMDPYDFMDHCEDVLKAIYILDASEARRIKKDRTEFDDPGWQWDWMGRQVQLMVDYIEAHSSGQAEIEVINYRGNLLDIRKHLYKQFGAGSGGNIHEKELDYDRGMPEKGKAAFPAECDMGEKLRQLESRRLYFSKMAGSEERRRTYTYCQETKLVRIVLEHVNKTEYGECVKRILDTVKTKRLVQSIVDGRELGVNGIPDNHERSFSDDWLPTWPLLKAGLLDEWSSRINDMGKTKDKNKGVLPVAMGGVKVVSCYGCGIQGHKKGDPGCNAGKYDAHADAPKDYRDRMEKKRNAMKNKRQEIGEKKTPGKPGTKKLKDGEKKHCHAFNFGKGSCRYGAKCHFLHDKDGGKGGKAEAFSPQQKKLVTALLSSAMKRTATAISKRNKKKAKVTVTKTKDKDGSESDNEDFSAMLASCFFGADKQHNQEGFCFNEE